MEPEKVKLAEIARRLTRLEDEQQIYRVLCRYGEALDYGLEDQFVDLFTADGRWTIRRTGTPDRTYQGPEQLRRFAQGHTRYPARVHKHVFSNLQVEVDGDSATALSYFFRLDASTLRDPEQPAISDSFIFEMGRYSDELVKQSGVWRFKERLVLGEDDKGNRPNRPGGSPAAK